jgi:hypothetical protein
MKPIFFTITFFLSCFFQLSGQQLYEVLDQNQVSTAMNSNGSLFSTSNTFSSAYEVPKGSGNHLMFIGQTAYAGINQNGDIKVASTILRDPGSFQAGPYSATDDYYEYGYTSNNVNSIWKVKRSDIIYHIDNYTNPNYTAPLGISEWPGNGNTNVGVSGQLAPYEDLNNNQVYEPKLGEYPCIKGDMAIYSIMNDGQFDNYDIGSEKMDLEVHTMMYQFSGNDYIDTTTFLNVKVINRGTDDYTDFKMMLYIDSDIGFSEDEHIGCDSTRNLAYTYNGDNNDEGGNGAPGYGINPPAVGIVSLNKAMDYFCPLLRSSTPGAGSPSNVTDYWNYMNGRWLDGTPWTYSGNGYQSGGAPTSYLYSGNPYTNQGWTEVNIDGTGTSNSLLDRRNFMVLEAQNLPSGGEVSYDFAVITARPGDHLRNVQGVIDLADEVKQYYDNNLVNYDCQETGTGSPDNIVIEEPNYQKMFEVTRVDGEGNMGRAVSIKYSTEQAIINNNSIDRITYERGKGPIDVELFDTVNYLIGHYSIKFKDYNNIDSANWTVYYHTTLNLPAVDSVHSDNTIAVGDQQIIPQWGLAIRIKQSKYVCSDGSNSCVIREQLALPLSSEVIFADTSQKWLTGVKHNQGWSPVNWNMTGTHNPSTLTSVPSIDPINQPTCYQSNSYDPNFEYYGMLDGIIAPGVMARNNGCGYNPVGIPDNITSIAQYRSVLNRIDQPTVFHPSVDIVFTADKSKWTRCPVIELNNDESTSLNNGKPGMLRQSPSVDKDGNQPGDAGYNASEANPNGNTPNGMGWFPGYAIDVESGRRLNMAYGENSTLVNDNGTDMIWNPTERLFDQNGDPKLGGQHTIYVFGGELHDMPNYDEGAFIHQKLTAETSTDFRAVYGNLSWVMQPLLNAGETLNSTDVRVKARINKEFKNRELTNLNNSRPMFEWEVVPYEQVGVEKEEITISELSIYPNPTNGIFSVSWDNLEVEKIQIFSYQGNLIYTQDVANNENKKQIDLQGLNSGIYIVKVGEEVRKIVLH